MNIPVHIAEKLILLLQGETLSASSVKHPIIEEMVSEGVLERKGRVHKTLSVFSQKALLTYLQNKHSINNLEKYLSTSLQRDTTRSEAIKVSGHSKLKKVRTFKGFLIHSYSPIHALIHGTPVTMEPTDGIFYFVSDFDHFAVSQDMTIVGIENAENYRFIAMQKELFSNINPIFISRYPQNQNKDVLKWLQSIPNRYLHFGDFDWAGIGIYLNEYKKHLGDKATFFVPENMEQLLATYGNRQLYDNQIINFNLEEIREDRLLLLITLIHQYKKGLEQEILINHEMIQ